MLIIFDLDDTLIDTTGSVTPVMLTLALKKMIKHGLKVPNFHVARFQLWVLDRKTSSSRETIKLFLAHMRADPGLLEVGMQEMYRELPSKLKVKLLKGAKKILEELSKKHLLALVTGGVPHFQQAKWEKAGIDSSIFSKIAVAEKSEKKIYYQNIALELKQSPSEIIVVGDRVSLDLVPAKELGFRTIQMRWGRGLQYDSRQDAVDYAISDLSEIKQIISHIHR